MGATRTRSRIRITPSAGPCRPRVSGSFSTLGERRARAWAAPERRPGHRSPRGHTGYLSPRRAGRAGDVSSPVPSAPRVGADARRRAASRRREEPSVVKGPLVYLVQGRKRRIPIIGHQRDYLAVYLADHDGGEFEFPCHGRWCAGYGPFSASALLTRAGSAWTAAGLTAIGLHDARQTFASHLLVPGCRSARSAASWATRPRRSRSASTSTSCSTPTRPCGRSWTPTCRPRPPDYSHRLSHRRPESRVGRMAKPNVEAHAGASKNRSARFDSSVPRLDEDSRSPVSTGISQLSAPSAVRRGTSANVCESDSWVTLWVTPCRVVGTVPRPA